MTSNQIHKYKKYSVSKLIEKAQIEFNKFIRKRDDGERCINCGNFRKLQAGHFYPTSTYSSMRFDEDNCHGECLQCNYFNSQSHSYGYSPNLKQKIGDERFKDLNQKALISKRSNKKWDRISLIEIIEKYKNINK